MKKVLLNVVALMFLSASVFAQKKITGKVTDENGAPISGASVVVKGTKVGTITDPNGNYSITAPDGSKALVISYVGQGEKEITIGSLSTYNVSLTAVSSSTEEVVVVGYSTTTKEAFTGSAKQVSGEQLYNKSVSNVSQALAGEVAGVRVINTSGQPGTSATIRIRGIGSVNGNRSPLYVVDGVPYSGTLNSINPADIASMTVLKDAAATSIYGSRGANGVIVITTLNGRSKKSFIEVDVKYGSNMALLPRYDVIKSPEEFIGLAWESIYNHGVLTANADPVAFANSRLFSANGISPAYNMWNAASVSDLIDPVTRQVRSGVTRKWTPENWEDYAFQSSNRTEANVKLGGGDAKTNYFTSIGYLEDKGYSINSDFKRLSGRFNLNHEVKPWLSTKLNVNYANSETNNNGQGSSSNSIFWFVDNIPSIYPLFLRNPTTGAIVADTIFGGSEFDYGAGGGTQRGFGGLTNSIADATYNTSRATRNDLTANLSFDFKITKHLSFDNRLGFQYNNNLAVTRNNKFYGSAAGQKGSLFHTRSDMMNLNLLNMLRYARKFGNLHSIEVLAAHEATKYKFTSAAAGGQNLVDNYGLNLDNAIVKIPGAVGSYTDINRLESYFAQANYDFESKYYVSGTIRRDGSSRFYKGEPWGTFGSVGLAWVVTKEKFLNQSKILDYLKLKASYGILGDQSGLGYYPGYDRINISNLNGNPSFGVPTPGNPLLTWESSKMFQVGAEFNLGKFITGSVDYYIKNTDNMIFNRSVGISNGYASITVNDGQLRNTGIEFDLTGHILKTKDAYIDLSVNGEHFKNEITRMPYDPSINGDKLLDIQGSYAYAKGNSVYDYYMRDFVGVNPATGLSQYKVFYEDANGDGAFNAGEQVINLQQFYNQNPDKIGTLKEGVTSTFAQATQYYVGKSSLPKLRGGINLSAGYKGFSLAVQFLYNIGGYSYDNVYAGLMGSGAAGGNNWHKDIFARWQAAGDVTNVPILSNNQTPNSLGASTRFLTKADFISLNNVRLAYTIPASLTGKIGIQQATIFAAGDNLWLGAARKGFNPSTSETGSSNTYTYSPLSTITAGVKIKF